MDRRALSANTDCCLMQWRKNTEENCLIVTQVALQPGSAALVVKTTVKYIGRNNVSYSVVHIYRQIDAYILVGIAVGYKQSLQGRSCSEFSNCSNCCWCYAWPAFVEWYNNRNRN